MTYRIYTLFKFWSPESGCCGGDGKTEAFVIAWPSQMPDSLRTLIKEALVAECEHINADSMIEETPLTSVDVKYVWWCNDGTSCCSGWDEYAPVDDPPRVDAVRVPIFSVSDFLSGETRYSDPDDLSLENLNTIFKDLEETGVYYFNVEDAYPYPEPLRTPALSQWFSAVKKIQRNVLNWLYRPGGPMFQKTSCCTRVGKE